MRCLFLLEQAAVEQADSSVVVELGFEVEQVDSAAESFVQQHKYHSVEKVELLEVGLLEALLVLQRNPHRPIHLLLEYPMLLLVIPSPYYGPIYCLCLVEPIQAIALL